MHPTAAPPPASPAPPANFGPFARFYAPVEWLSFGRALTRRRECFLGHAWVAQARRVLVLGDGDGRFTAALLRRNPSVQITAVDVSANMLAHLERRVRARTPDAQLELQCADVRSWTAPVGDYDLVVCHFFFDCFTSQDLARLIPQVTRALAPNAHWLVSEFAIPSHPFWTPVARIMVRFLYFTIGTLTGLSHSQLPDYQSALKSAGFEVTEVQTALGGTLRSELWRA